MLNSEKQTKKEQEIKKTKNSIRHVASQERVGQPIWAFLRGQVYHPWKTPARTLVFPPDGATVGTETIPELSLPFPALEYKFFSICSCQYPRPSKFLFSYLSTAVASVVDCRERETEASGTAQSQEVAETPQRGWGEGEERSGKAVGGGTQLLANSCRFLGLPRGKQKQLQAIPRPICRAISKITHQFKVNYIFVLDHLSIKKLLISAINGMLVTHALPSSVKTPDTHMHTHTNTYAR